MHTTRQKISRALVSAKNAQSKLAQKSLSTQAVIHKVDTWLHEQKANFRISSLFSFPREVTEQQVMQEQKVNAADRATHWQNHLRLCDQQARANFERELSESKTKALEEAKMQMRDEVARVSTRLYDITFGSCRGDCKDRRTSHLVQHHHPDELLRNYFLFIRNDHRCDYRDLFENYRNYNRMILDRVSHASLENIDSIKTEVTNYCNFVGEYERKLEQLQNTMRDDMELALIKRKWNRRIYDVRYGFAANERDVLRRHIDSIVSLADSKEMIRELQEHRNIIPIVKDQKHQEPVKQHEQPIVDIDNRIKTAIYQLAKNNLAQWQRYLLGGCWAGSKVQIDKNTTVRVPRTIKKIHDIIQKSPLLTSYQEIIDAVKENRDSAPNRHDFTRNTYCAMFRAITTKQIDCVEELEKSVTRLINNPISNR